MSNQLCLTPKCFRIAAQGKRGLCLVCYSEAKKLVDTGTTTWDDLVRMGMATEGPSSFTSAFNEAKEKDAKNK